MSKASQVRLLPAFLRQSLMAQAVALLVTVLLGVGLLARLVFVPLLSQAFDREVQKRGDAMVGILDQNREVRVALALRDPDRAYTVAQEVLRGDPEARYVMLLDPDGALMGLAIDRVHGIDRDTVVHVLRTPANGNAEEGGIHRFTREVVRDEDEAVDLGDGSGIDPGKLPRNLGKVVLGLSASSSKDRVGQLTFWVVFLTGVSLLVVFFLFFLRLVTRIDRLTRQAERAAAGDLMSGIRGERDDIPDELGRLGSALVLMTGNMASVVGRLQEAATALATASADILNSSTQQGRSASRQASSVSETGATLSELRQIFAQAAERAQAVIDLAKRSEDSTSSGRTAVQESVLAMEQIRDEVSHISSSIQGLVERTQRIGAIVDTVNDLAEQSNVLALNAAIEAARAGDQGKGFAVVAREVRNLARRSKESTGEIRAILEDIGRASREAIAVIHEGSRKTHSGVELATRAGESIVNLDQAIDASSTAAKQIAASIRQQSAGMEQIWQAMKDVDRSVQESVSGIQQLESASKTIKDLSDRMMELVSAYRVSAAASSSGR
jgi:methyl-accepting chemotaxis protein